MDSFQPFLGDTTGGQIDMYSARMHLSHGLCETFREFTRRSRFVQLPRTSLSSDPAPVEGTVRKKGTVSDPSSGADPTGALGRFR